MRIFIGESDRVGHRPLHVALLELLRARGLAGATVIKGAAGFGANSVIHTASILRLSEDLPLVIDSWTASNISRPCYPRSTAS
jgi:PII-like signaling protein